MRLFRRLGAFLKYAAQIFYIIDYKLFFKELQNIPQRFLLNWSYFKKQNTVDNFPSYAIVELTNICNLNCIMCPSAQQTRSRGHIKKETFIKLVEQFREKKVELVDFSLYGEILIHPEFDWFIEYARANGLKTSVSTNASFLSPENSERLINSGLDFLVISIDDVSGGKYNDIRLGNNFDKIMAQVKGFLALNRGRVFTTIQKIHMSQNIDSTYNYINEMSELGANLVRLKPYRDKDMKKTFLRTRKVKNLEKIQCPYLWKIPVFTWNGELVPCCNDFNATMPMGNIHDVKDINEIWNGKAFQNLRDTHIQQKKENVDLCKGCISVEFGYFSLFMSSFFDGLNAKKVLCVFQTSKILFRELFQVKG